MAAISRKNVATLVDDFIKRPMLFENYSKHCINLLNAYIWLRKNQFQNQINHFDYFQKAVESFGLTQVDLTYMFDDFNKIVINEIPQNKKNTIKSNMYYFSQIDAFYESIKNHSIKNNKLLETDKKFIKFFRLDFTIINLSNNLDLDKEYTYHEIYQLVLNHEIIVLDNFLSADYIYLTNINDDINRIYLKSEVHEILGIKSKMIDNYYAFKNSNSKELWGLINSPFCNYFRQNIIEFNSTDEDKKINGLLDFYEIINHLETIINKLCSYYKKRKKALPGKIERIEKYNYKQIEILKKQFESIGDMSQLKNDKEKIFEIKPIKK